MSGQTCSPGRTSWSCAWSSTHRSRARSSARRIERARSTWWFCTETFTFHRAAIELGPESEIGWSAPYILDWVRRWPEENPAVISLTGNPTPELLADLDPSLVGRADPRDIRTAMLENITDRHVNWTIVAAPNEGWATQVFGEPDVESLWAAVARATRLDQPDPVAAWREHAAMLQTQADALNERLRRGSFPRA